jgi:hypothetical protein
MKINLIIFAFFRTIRACECLLLLFMRLFWLFVFSCRTLKWVRKYYWPMMVIIWARKCWSARGMSGHESVEPPKDMFYSSSVGTLTCDKSLVTCGESVLTSCLNNSQ